MNETAHLEPNVDLTHRPSFQLIIPASESNPELCKTLLSAFVLGYPAPTLINWGTKNKAGAVFKESSSHTAKIQGVYDYLNDKKQVSDEDLVIIIDGYDVWFQLPPQVLVERYRELLEDTNQRLKARYGMISEDQDGDNLVERVPKYVQKVLFGADKICWPNPKNDPACTAVPYSTLPKDVYGPETDKDPKAFLNPSQVSQLWQCDGTCKGRPRCVRACSRKGETGRRRTR